MRSPSLIFRSHAVLIQVSLGYPPLPGMYPRVTHPFATEPMLYCYPTDPVRLACLIHAASVRSEPESNSPKNIGAGILICQLKCPPLISQRCCAFLTRSAQFSFCFSRSEDRHSDHQICSLKDPFCFHSEPLTVVNHSVSAAAAFRWRTNSLVQLPEPATPF